MEQPLLKIFLGLLALRQMFILGLRKLREKLQISFINQLLKMKMEL
jgi:hypothetical protein